MKCHGDGGQRKMKAISFQGPDRPSGKLVGAVCEEKDLKKGTLPRLDLTLLIRDIGTSH